MTTTTLSSTQARVKAKKRIKLIPIQGGFKCPAETNTCYLGRVQVGRVMVLMTLDELDGDNTEDQ